MKFRSFVCMVLCIALTVTGVVYAGAKSTGDVDGSGMVTVDDARLTLRFAVKLESPANETQKENADADGNGEITVDDARLILRVAVKLQELAEAVKESQNNGQNPGKEENTTNDGQETKKDDTADFNKILYDEGHQYFEKTYLALPQAPVLPIYATAKMWCCYYTIQCVFRPALYKAGYSEEKINQIAPYIFERAKIAKVLQNVGKALPDADISKLRALGLFASDKIPMYVPSLLLDYYINHPEYCKTYTFYEYYDDIIAEKVYEPDSDPDDYTPRVGDIIFMSNKASTYENGFPTVDHTAQIIEVYENGNFLCTEGSIIIKGEPDDLPRVRERVYKYSSKKDTFVYKNNSSVIVLAIVRPDLNK